MKKYQSVDRRDRRHLCTQCIEVPTVFHVLSQPQLWNDALIASELARLNQLMADTPFYFTLQSTTRITITTNSSAFLPTMIAQLRRGDASVLNIFIHDVICNLAHGQSSLPQERGIFPEGRYSIDDAIQLCIYSYGEDSVTLVHEVGHFLGLLHVFDGEDCFGVGDMVDDTPAMATPTNNVCPLDKDTCPTLPGLDPVQNYMDYSSCRSEFTAGQIDRMLFQYQEYRQPLTDCSNGTLVELDLTYGSVLPKQLSYMSLADPDMIEVSLLPTQQDFLYNNLESLTGTKSICLDALTVYQFLWENDPSYPSTLVVKMNGREVNFDEGSFMLQGSGPCSGKRWGLDLSFTPDLSYYGSPNAVGWTLKGSSSGATVMDYRNTTNGQSAYSGEYTGRVLSVDSCIPEETTIDSSLTFSLSNLRSGPLNAAVIYYRLALNGRAVYHGLDPKVTIQLGS
jgi:hypothetical protein